MSSIIPLRSIALSCSILPTRIILSGSFIPSCGIAPLSLRVASSPCRAASLGQHHPLGQHPPHIYHPLAQFHPFTRHRLLLPSQSSISHTTSSSRISSPCVASSLHGVLSHAASSSHSIIPSRIIPSHNLIPFAQHPHVSSPRTTLCLAHCSKFDYK